MVLKMLFYSYNMWIGRNEDALISDCETKFIFLPNLKFSDAGYLLLNITFFIWPWTCPCLRFRTSCELDLSCVGVTFSFSQLPVHIFCEICILHMRLILPYEYFTYVFFWKYIEIQKWFFGYYNRLEVTLSYIWIGLENF